MSQDDLEIWFEKGVSDGLPVIPPTRERVERMLAGTRRERDELLGSMPPNYGRLTVEKAAINAILAGCRPDYLPVVIAAAECACDPAFNLHGVSTSTHFSAPLIVVNGPIRPRIGLNSSFGVFGPGYRANATIGRALRLLMINIGGARPGEISMSTFGHPGRYTYCIAENEEASPWPAYHVGRGFAPDASTITLFAGDSPHGISDHASRTARELGGSLGWSMAGPGTASTSRSIPTRCWWWGPSTRARSPMADGRRTISSGTSMRPCGDRIGRSCPTPTT